jgi:hypothetical protein
MQPVVRLSDVDVSQCSLPGAPPLLVFLSFPSRCLDRAAGVGACIESTIYCASLYMENACEGWWRRSSPLCIFLFFCFLSCDGAIHARRAGGKWQFRAANPEANGRKKSRVTVRYERRGAASSVVGSKRSGQASQAAVARARLFILVGPCPIPPLCFSYTLCPFPPRYDRHRAQRGAKRGKSARDETTQR